MISYFSIVIPTYNRASRIVQAIQSILTQSFQDFEIIVIDDSSNDETAKLMESYIELFINVKYVINLG